MSDNPYQAPAEEPPLVKPPRVWLREDFQVVVKLQKGVLATIVVYLLFIAGPFMSPPEGRLFSIFILAILGLIGTVYVYPLGTMFYTTSRAISFTVLMIIPGVGLFILLMIAVKTTMFLNSHGIKAGLLGVNLADI